MPFFYVPFEFHDKVYQRSLLLCTGLHPPLFERNKENLKWTCAPLKVHLSTCPASYSNQACHTWHLSVKEAPVLLRAQTSHLLIVCVLVRVSVLSFSSFLQTRRFMSRNTEIRRRVTFFWKSPRGFQFTPEQQPEVRNPIDAVTIIDKV